MFCVVQPVTHLTHEQVDIRARQVAEIILRMFPNGTQDRPKHFLGIYPVPRGGVPAAYLVARYLDKRFFITQDITKADIIFDDLIDSGATRKKYAEQHPTRPFLALYDKTEYDGGLGWIVFPWEGTAESSIEDATVRLLQFIGEDPNRDGLKDTPGRVARAWQTWAGGYGQDPKDILKTFEGEPNDDHNEMVLVRGIPFYTHCEHHLVPFFGTADIAYIPGETGRIVGLSKLSRVLDVYARRLQVQERLTSQVAQAIMDCLGAKGSAVCLRARHLCMESRGVKQQGQETVTQKLLGVFYEDARTRNEFMGLIS